MLPIAFKEWAAVCQAMAQGRQTLLLRKGGIAEEQGEFRPEHSRFWLFPTYFHEQQQNGLQPEGLPYLQTAEGSRPAPDTLRFSHFAEVMNMIHITEQSHALSFQAYHIWNEDTVRQRFQYRTPGLYALIVRIHQNGDTITIHDDPSYAGCKSWVTLQQPLAINDPHPVLTDDEFNTCRQSILAAS